MKWHYGRKWILLATVTIGTTLQLATCQEELALFGLRTAFSTVTWPINTMIRQFLLTLG